MLYNRCIDDHGVLTWVMLVGTSLEANDRFIGSGGLVLRYRRPIATNPSELASLLCDSHAGCCHSDLCIRKRCPDGEVL